MNKKVLKTRNYSKDGYEVRTELVDGSQFGCDDFQMRSAYNKNGEYIGMPKDARYICHTMGISPEKAKENHSFCSIGYCSRDNKWYGWSHRAIFGFGIGDKLFLEDYGDEETPFSDHGSTVIENLDQAKQAAINFAAYVS